MSFLSVLGKIGKFAAPIAGVAAAPLTGGSSLLIPSLIGAGGAAASQMAGNMAHDRGTSAQLTLDANHQFENELMAREANRRANTQQDTHQSIFGSMLAGFHPNAVRPEGMPQSPFANGLPQHTIDAATLAGNNAFGRMKAGDTLPTLQRPDLSKFTHSSIWEKLLGLGGAAAQTYGAMQSPAMNGR